MKLRRTVPAPALVLALALALAGPPAASSAQTGGQATPTVDSWAVSPTGADPSQPSTRPNLSYEVGPGTSVEDSVTLWNYGTTELAFRVYATDAFNNTSGSFDLLAGDKAPADVGAWVTGLPTEVLAVPARRRLDLPFKLTVPSTARAGDHAGAILASTIVEGRGEDGKIVRLDRRTGTRLYLRVAGALHPSLTVEDVHAAYRASPNPFGGGTTYTYTIRNTGNVRLGAHQKVQLKNPFGKRMKEETPPDLIEILPGNAVTVTARPRPRHPSPRSPQVAHTFRGVTAALRVVSEVTVTPFAVGQPGAATATPVARSGHAWAIPWSVIAAIVLAFAGWWGSKRYQQRRVAHPTPAPPGSGGARALADIG
jgi:hypothetical protein